MCGHVVFVMPMIARSGRSSRQWIFGSGAEGKECIGDYI